MPMYDPKNVGPVANPEDYARMLDPNYPNTEYVQETSFPPNVEYVAESAVQPSSSSAIAMPQYGAGSSADTEELRRLLRERLQAKLDTRALESAQQRSAKADLYTGLAEAGTMGLMAATGGQMPQGMFDSSRERNKQILNDYLSKKKAEELAASEQLDAAKGLSTLEQAKNKEKNAIEQQKFENLLKKGQYDIQKEYAKLAGEKVKDNQYVWRIDPETGKMKAYPKSGTVEEAKPSEPASFYMSLNPKERQLYDKTKKAAYSDSRIKGAQEQLTTIQQIDAKLQEVEKGDLGQLPVAINNAARAIGGEKGVMTDRDVLRASGLPTSYLGASMEQFKSKLAGLPPDRQIATLKAMTASSKRIYNQNVNALAQGYRQDFERVSGKKAPETESFIPPSISPVQESAALNPKDQQALDWANANPSDPRSAKIKQRLGK